MKSLLAKPRRKRSLSSSDDDPGSHLPASACEVSASSTPDRRLPTRIRTNRHSQESSGQTHVQDEQTRQKPSSQKARYDSKVKTQTSKRISEFFNRASRDSGRSSTVSGSQLQPHTLSPVPVVDEPDDSIEDSSDNERHTAKVRAARITKGDKSTSSSQREPGGDLLHDRGAPKKVNTPNGSQRFRISKEGRPPTQSHSDGPDPIQRPWTEQFAPANLEELAVNKKKVQDLRAWLERYFKGTTHESLLVLKGPAGAGKSSTVKLLAQSMGIDLLEWRNPLGFNHSLEGYVSLSAQFDDFLSRGHRYGGLEVETQLGLGDEDLPRDQLISPSIEQRKIVLLEEFPSTLVPNSIALQSFRQSIHQYLADSSRSTRRDGEDKEKIFNRSLLVLIITESRLSANRSTSETFTMNRLLGVEIHKHPAVKSIEFNPVAASFLQKALDIVIQKEARRSGRRRIPGPALLKELCNSGDITSAISSLEFLCIKNIDDAWSGRVAAIGKKATSQSNEMTDAERQMLNNISSRETSLGLFHAVGKIVYNKRIDTSATGSVEGADVRLPHHHSKISQVCLDDLMSECGTDVDTFIAALYENYLPSCGVESFTESADVCLDALSDGDLLGISGIGPRKRYTDYVSGATRLDNIRQDEVAFQLVTRGIQFGLPYPVKRLAIGVKANNPKQSAFSSHQMVYPSSVRISRQIEDMEALLEQWHRKLVLSSYRFDLKSHSNEDISSAKAYPNPQVSENVWPTDPNPEDPPRSLPCSGRDLLLDQLPYIYMIRRGPQHTHSRDMQELRNITTFSLDTVNDQLIDQSDDEEGEGVSYADGSEFEKKSMLMMTKEKEAPLRGEVGMVEPSALTPLGPPSKLEMENLYLDDDDIEDD